MSRLGCLRNNFTREQDQIDWEQELKQLVVNPTISIDTIFARRSIKNGEWMPETDKIKISVDKKRFKFRKLIGSQKINLEDFFRQLIYIIYDRESRRRNKLSIGFSWIISDENNETEYVSCRKSKLIDDWLFKIDYCTKLELLNQIQDMNLNDFDAILRKAVDDHVFEDHCDHRITSTIHDENVLKARETIFKNRRKHLRCSGRCYLKNVKSAVAMYAQIETE